MTRSELADDAFCTVLDKLSDAFNRLSFGIFMYYDQSLPQFEQVTVEQDNGYARFAIFDRNFPDRVSWTCIRYHWADDRFEWFNYVAEGNPLLPDLSQHRCYQRRRLEVGECAGCVSCLRWGMTMTLNDRFGVAALICEVLGGLRSCQDPLQQGARGIHQGTR